MAVVVDTQLFRKQAYKLGPELYYRSIVRMIEVSTNPKTPIKIIVKIVKTTGFVVY